MDDLIQELSEYAQSIFRCNLDSIHGMEHWKRVDESAKLICRETSADLIVVRFFAYLHDSCRLNDGSDWEHGPRSADLLRSLPAELAVLDSDQLSLLDHAMRHHTKGGVTDEPTVGACWDSDRLDLGRVGIIPSAIFMSTEPARMIANLGCTTLDI